MIVVTAEKSSFVWTADKTQAELFKMVEHLVNCHLVNSDSVNVML